VKRVRMKRMKMVSKKMKLKNLISPHPKSISMPIALKTLLQKCLEIKLLLTVMKVQFKKIPTRKMEWRALLKK